MMSLDPSTLDKVLKALGDAETVVTKHADKAMDPERDFGSLSDSLLDVSKAIATINKERILHVGQEVADLPHDAKERLKSVVNFGIRVASLMVDDSIRPTDAACDVFISYPGTEKSLYLAVLDKALKGLASPDHHIFIAHKALPEAMTQIEADTRKTMLASVANATHAIVLLTVEGAQKYWVIAELLLAYARNRTRRPGSRSLVLDAFPGSPWVAAFDGGMLERHPTSWVSDITRLIPMRPEPQFYAYNEADVIAHAEAIAGTLFDPRDWARVSTHARSEFSSGSVRSSIVSFADTPRSPSQRSRNDSIVSWSSSMPDVNRPPPYAHTEGNQVYRAILDERSGRIDKDSIDDLLREARNGSFAVRRSSVITSEEAIVAVKGEASDPVYHHWWYDSNSGKIVHIDGGNTTYFPSLATFLASVGALYYKAHDHQISKVNTILTRAAEAVRRKQGIE